MTNVAYRPPTLREFLDSGADFTSIPNLDIDHLATTICLQDRGTRPSWREGFAETMSLVAEHLIAGKPDPFPVPMKDGREPPRRADYGTPGHIATTQWAADAFGEPELVERLVECLPEPVRYRVRRNWDNRQHPHPLIVEEVAEDWCSACGDWFAGPSVQIGVVEGWSDDAMESPPTYCAPCIRIAAAATGDGDVVVIP